MILFVEHIPEKMLPDQQLLGTYQLITKAMRMVRNCVHEIPGMLLSSSELVQLRNIVRQDIFHGNRKRKKQLTTCRLRGRVEHN